MCWVWPFDACCHLSSVLWQQQVQLGHKAAARGNNQEEDDGEEEERTADGRRERLCLTVSLGDDDPTGLSEPAVLFLMAAPPLLGEAGSGRVLLFCFLVGLFATALLLCRLQPQPRLVQQS